MKRWKLSFIAGGRQNDKHFGRAAGFCRSKHYFLTWYGNYTIFTQMNWKCISMHSISASEKIKIKIYVYTEPAHKWFLQFNTQLSKNLDINKMSLSRWMNKLNVYVYYFGHYYNFLICNSQIWCRISLLNAYLAYVHFGEMSVHTHFPILKLSFWFSYWL